MANELDYTEYDFDYLVQQIQSRLSNKDTWQDVYRSSTGEMLIEFLAYVLNLGMYYTERRAEESYINTARNISSVKHLVSILNYVPKRKSSALGNLTFSISAPLTKVVYIPKYTSCKSSAGIEYLTNVDAAIEKGQTDVTIASIQGTKAVKEVVADGAQDQEYTLESTAVENSADESNRTLTVVVNGTLWTKTDSFIYSTSTDTHYRIINEPDGRVTIAFGDSVNGLIPSNGANIVINYIVSVGVAGNVTYPGMITNIASTIYDEDASPVAVTVTNAGSLLGGDDEEDIEEIRYEAPRLFKTGDRAVSKYDFDAIFENYPGIANTNTWGENEEALENGVAAVESMLNKVKICMIMQNWILPDTGFQDLISAYIYKKSMMTVKYEFVDPVILDVIPTMRVTVKTGHSMSQTQADISEVMALQFELGKTTKLGTMVKYSNILSVVDGLDNVAYCTMVLELRKELPALIPNTTWSGTLDCSPIAPESVRVIIDGTEVGHDQDNDTGVGAFNFVGLMTGAVDYATGAITLTADPGLPVPPENVVIRYQQNAASNIRPQLRQICKLDSVDIQSIEME